MKLAQKIFPYLVFLMNTDLWAADIDIYNQDAILATARLPLSVNVQGTNDNQVYIGMFRPDRHAPVWQGNLKLYQIGIDAASEAPLLIDADGKPVVDATSGLVNKDARSFWTYGNNNPDGDDVSLGGVAQGLRDYVAAARANFTCTGLCNSLEPFAVTNTNLVFEDFDAQDVGQMHSIINWATEVAGNPVHGDVIHSTPAVINYGGSTGTYVFYGANDGMFHGVKGGLVEKSALLSSNDGEEVWTFTAPEQFKGLKALYDRHIAYSSGDRAIDTFANKPYFFDGPVTSYLQYNSNNQIGNDPQGETSQAIIYLIARGGGSLIYALDVTNPVTPKVIWHKNNRDLGFTELGQTWSAPQQARLRIGSSNISEGVQALFMGLGYDQVAADEGRSASAEGRGIIVVNALNGEIIWRFAHPEAAVDFAIPANLTVIDRNSDGYADRVYFADTGGQLWRLDMQSTNPADWQATRLLVLPSGGTFFNAPDIISSADGSYDGVIIGSGDREKPFDTGVQNYLLFYRDYATAGPAKNSHVLSLHDLKKVTIESGSLLFDGDITTDPEFKNGWYLPLETGEKVVTRGITESNITRIATYIPCIATNCDSLGESRIYRIDPFLGSAEEDNDKAYRVVEKGGILPQPTKFTVVIESKNCHKSDCNSEKKIISAVLFGAHIEPLDNQALGVRRKLWWYNNRD